MKDVPFTPLAAAAGGEGTVFSCALCGTRFTHGRQACGACPLNTGCEVVSCPSCGHSFPRSSRLAAWIRRLFGRKEQRTW